MDRSLRWMGRCHWQCGRALAALAIRLGLASGLLCAAAAQAGCLDSARLLGVNLAGAEFGGEHLPGTLFKDYFYPGRAELARFRSMGMTMVRLPLRWERIQHQSGTALDPNELAQLRRVLGWARELDLCVLLDLHNYGNYFGRPIGGTDVSATAFTDVWLRLNQALPDPRHTAFGLMNEPAALAPTQWRQIAQDTVLALRRAGARHLLLVPSGRWSGAHEWDQRFEGVSAAMAWRDFQDPLERYAIELHQYADASFSGTGTACIAPERLRDVMARVSTWARQERKQLFLGEFGVAASTECLQALRSLLDGMQDTTVWLGWTYWAAGAWWGNYPFSIQPTAGPEAAQLTLLRAYLPVGRPFQAAPSTE